MKKKFPKISVLAKRMKNKSKYSPQVEDEKHKKERENEYRKTN